MDKMIETLIDRVSTRHDDAIANENVYTTIENEAKEIFGKRIKKLEHHEATTVGLYATDKPIKDLLHLFFNSKSDVCKLEAAEQEDIEKAFAEWVETVSFRITGA